MPITAMIANRSSRRCAACRSAYSPSTSALILERERHLVELPLELVHDRTEIAGSVQVCADVDAAG